MSQATMAGDGGASYEMTAADITAAQHAWWEARATWRLILRLAAAWLVLSSLVRVAMDREAAAAVLASASLAWSVLGALAFAALFVLLSRYQAARVGRRLWRENKTLAGTFTYRWNEAALHIQHAHGNANVPWSVFHSWVDAPAVLLVCQSSLTFNVLPKRALRPGDAEAVVGFLRAAGVPERRRFGLIRSRLARAA